MNNKKKAFEDRRVKEHTDLFYKNQKLLEKLNKIATRRPFAKQLEVNNIMYRRQ